MGIGSCAHQQKPIFRKDKDLDGILTDIQEAHKHDRLSTPEELPTEVFARAIAGLSGMGSEKLDGAMKAAEKMFGLEKDDLSDEDWTAFIRIIQTVERKNKGKRRGKR